MKVKDGTPKAKLTPINLNLTVRNFGPVEHADINIKPLTILIGPNNSGKSYVAMLLQSILIAQSRVGRSRYKVSGAVEACRDILRKKYEHDQYRMNITRPESKKILRVMLDKEMRPALESQIIRDFGSNLRDLVRTGKRSATAEVSEYNAETGDVQKLSIKLGRVLFARATVKPPGYVAEAVQKSRYYRVTTDGRTKHQNSADPIAKEVMHMLPNVLYHPIAGVVTDPDTLCTSCAIEITERVSNYFQFKTVSRNIYYFPAARSGILQGYKALSASIVEHAPYDGVKPIEMPRVTGVVSDFLSRIILLKQKNAPYTLIAKDMENEMFGGNIVLDTTTNNEYPEITYRANGSPVPLHRSSSTISEIAPLSLCLKHIVGENSFLIIEEPEAHLHPANQVILAKYIVRLVRGGVNILITTHSVFLLEKLAKYMLASSLEPKQRSKDLGYGQNDFLTQDEVSAYLFEKSPSGGYQTKPVERDDEYGISQEEFVKVTEDLHRETIIINSRMGGNDDT